MGCRVRGTLVVVWAVLLAAANFGFATAVDDSEFNEEKFMEVYLDMDDTNIREVTVYRDRSEVTRTITYQPMGVGVVALVLRGLVGQADQESIRVGASNDPSVCTDSPTEYTILEVQHELRHRAINGSDSGTSEEEKDAQRNLDEATVELKKINGELSRVDAQAGLVQKYTEGMLTATAPPTQGGSSAPASTTSPSVGTDLEAVTKLLDFHLERLEGADRKRDALAADKLRETARKEAASATLNRLNKQRKQQRHSFVTSRDVTVHLQVTKLGNAVSLELAYLTSGASWRPSYDIRITSATDDTSAKMDITYFGVVKQNTGEDWSNTHLSLSTALPALGGSPPTPPTKIARWKQPVVQAMRAAKSRSGSAKHRNMPEMMSTGAAMMMMADEEDGLEHIEAAMAMETPTFADHHPTMAVSSSGSGTATFHIERRCSVLSDNKEHKVTVAVLNLEPQLRHFAVPALETKAYIQARAENSSPYPLLEGTQAAIFFDGAFVTTAHLKETSAGEDINLFVGSDADVKIQHRQIDSRTGRGKEGGFFKGEELSSHSFEYLTVIQNSKPSPVNVTVVSVLPQSSDKKIAVSLEKPDPLHVTTIRAPDDISTFLGLSGSGRPRDAKVAPLVGGGHVAQNEVTNNLITSVTVGAREGAEVAFKYVVEWPVEDGRDVEGEAGAIAVKDSNPNIIINRSLTLTRHNGRYSTVTS